MGGHGRRRVRAEYDWVGKHDLRLADTEVRLNSMKEADLKAFGVDDRRIDTSPTIT